eukprot:COSAG02_NODE_11212_length_1770_cov_1.057451_3_plen_61_part_00
MQQMQRQYARLTVVLFCPHRAPIRNPSRNRLRFKVRATLAKALDYKCYMSPRSVYLAVYQ